MARCRSPSDVFARDGRQIARSLGTEEVAQLVRRFAQAARRAITAGYQAIEVHGAHGYLPMAFLSPRKNRRDDAWGGDFERRMAFPLAIARVLREQLGGERPLIYRLSAAEFVEAGLTLEDMERIAPRLAQAGCDALQVSSGAVEGALDDVGGALVASAAPPFKEPLRWYQDHLRHRLALSGVTVHLGRLAQAQEILALKPALAIVATGSRVRDWPMPEGAATLAVLDATDVLTGVCGLFPHGLVTRIDAQGVTITVVGQQPRFIAASALVMARGREPVADLLSVLRHAGVACAAIGDAHAIGRIGDAVHAAHDAVRALLAESQHA